MRDNAIALFRSVFGAAPRSAASAPGRVNLIGEHTDYNGGPVLPMAIDRRTTVAAGPAPAGWLEVVSALDGRVHRLDWRGSVPREWPAYIVGVLRELWVAEAGPPGGGARVAVAGDVPVGAGLASSAALTVAAARALSGLSPVGLTARQLAGVAFRAESDQVGVRCGMMDPLVAALAKPGRALLVECASLAARHVPFPARLLVVDTGVRRELAASAYHARRAECDRAVARLKVHLPELEWLASWPVGWLARLKKALPEPVRARAVHVVSETARARYAAQLLERGRLKAFGALLYESHESCARYFECSAPELDLVVAAARRAGAPGARLTGAGWGGAAIVLVGGERDRGRGKREARIEQAIRRAFKKEYGREPGIVPVRPSGGVREERV